MHMVEINPPRKNVPYVVISFFVGVGPNPAGNFFKLALARPPDPIRPTRRDPDPNRPMCSSKEEGCDVGGFVRGGGLVGNLCI